MTGIIYKATNKLNGMIYIGQTSRGLRRRITEHLRVDDETHFQRSLKKYGIDSFEFTIIDSSNNRDELNKKEREWIKIYNCKKPNGYNLNDGGEGLFNPSQETRNKLSIASKGNTRRLGKTHSEETKKRLSLFRTGMKLSEEHKKKIGEASKGHTLSPESRLKVSIANKGKKRPDLAEINRNKTEEQKRISIEKRLKTLALRRIAA
jgi:group I intron endonuclease